MSLWQRISAFSLDDADAAFPFSRRLARENGWSHRYALRVIEEYKRFMFLVCNSELPLTPSDQVDQAWHLHLLYTRSYWEDFCPNVLGRAIHHGPTKGGEAERENYRECYERTLTLYLQHFGLPPRSIWPDTEVRFEEIRFRRVNLHRNWVVPKGFFRRKKKGAPRGK